MTSAAALLPDEAPTTSTAALLPGEAPGGDDSVVRPPARRAAAAILRIAWPVVVSATVSWSQSFFTIWLLGDAGSKLSLAAFGLANMLCNVTGHSMLWGLGSGLDTLASQA